MLATVAVNLITCLGLLLALRGRLGGLPLGTWSRDTFLLLLAALLGGLVAWGLAQGVQWPAGLWGLILQTGLGGLSVWPATGCWPPQRACRRCVS